MTSDEAADLTAAMWEYRRPEIISWMKKCRGFTDQGAVIACRNFIETMIYVAEQTGEPQLGRLTRSA